MSFDIAAYSKAFDKFIINMEKLHDMNDPGLIDAISELCSILHIGKISIMVYESVSMEQLDKGTEKIVFDLGEFDPEHCLRLRESIGNGNVVWYSFFQTIDSDDWTEDEKHRIVVFEKAFFSFNGRSRVMSMIDNLTYYDADIGIPNLHYFIKTADQLITSGQISDFGSCYFNLKRFSIINQHIGRQKATDVMKIFIKQLSDKLNEKEIVCRVSGDNFIALFEKEHVNIVNEHLGGIGITYDTDKNQRVFVSAYAGYYMIPDNCHSSDEIIDNLGIAINTARNVMKVNSIFFDEKLKDSRNEVKMIENEFIDAIEKDEFQVFYQPKVNLKNYTICGAEALCRWIRNGEIILPYRFIPALEQSKSICTLDFYVLERTCRDIRRWLDEGRPVVKVSVNLSRRHLGDMDLLEHIISSIDKYNVPHEYIEIELTETTTDVDFGDLKKIVVGLREAGISTAVDDFGIGYSSLNLIKELPWNVLKIDKIFLPDENDSNTQKYSMLKHIIALVQDIGLKCIVEGVETAEHVRLLKENNCFLAQGFYFDKPLPVSDFEKRLDELKTLL